MPDTINPFQAAGWQLVNGAWTRPDQVPGASGAPGSPTTPGLPGTTPDVGTPSYGGNLPSYLLDKTAGNLNDQLSGVLPQDVTDQIRNSAASFGVANGLVGSDFSGYHGLNQLGLTSLDQMNKATSALTPMFTTPKEGAGLSLEQQKLAEQRRQFDAQLAMEKSKQSYSPRGGYNPVPGYGNTTLPGYGGNSWTTTPTPTLRYSTDPTGRPMW